MTCAPHESCIFRVSHYGSLSLISSCVSSCEHALITFTHRYDDGCEADTHGTLIRKLLDDDKVHFMFGSSPLFAEAESAAADSAGRLMYHCCVGSDALYEQVCVLLEFCSQLLDIGTEQHRPFFQLLLLKR